MCVCGLFCLRPTDHIFTNVDRPEDLGKNEIQADTRLRSL